MKQPQLSNGSLATGIRQRDFCYVPEVSVCKRTSFDLFLTQFMASSRKGNHLSWHLCPALMMSKRVQPTDSRVAQNLP